MKKELKEGNIVKCIILDNKHSDIYLDGQAVAILSVTDESYLIQSHLMRSPKAINKEDIDLIPCKLERIHRETLQFLYKSYKEKLKLEEKIASINSKLETAHKIFQCYEFVNIKSAEMLIDEINYYKIDRDEKNDIILSIGFAKRINKYFLEKDGFLVEQPTPPDLYGYGNFGKTVKMLTSDTNKLKELSINPNLYNEKLDKVKQLIKETNGLKFIKIDEEIVKLSIGEHISNDGIDIVNYVIIKIKHDTPLNSLQDVFKRVCGIIRGLDDNYLNNRYDYKLLRNQQRNSEIQHYLYFSPPSNEEINSWAKFYVDNKKEIKSSVYF